MNLTDQEKRIKVADACPRLACKNIYGQYVWIENQSRFFDPLNDLNAMHEAEKVLTFHQETEYVANLMRQHKDYPMTKSFLATAAQRFDAFGKTLNLW
jgi:hypothetical protein